MSYRYALALTWAHCNFCIYVNSFIWILHDNNVTFFKPKFIESLGYAVSSGAIISISSFYEKRQTKNNLSLLNFLKFIKEHKHYFPCKNGDKLAEEINLDIDIFDEKYEEAYKLIAIRDNLLGHISKSKVVKIQHFLDENRVYDKTIIDLKKFSKNIIEKYSKYFDGKKLKDLEDFVRIPIFNEIEESFKRLCNEEYLVKLAARSIEIESMKYGYNLLEEE